MAKPSVVINTVTYQNVPEVNIPASPSGTAKFYYTGDADLAAGYLLAGHNGYGASGEVNGSIQSKAAATYNPSSSSQTISADQYLSGAQTIAAVTTTNLSAQNIKYGVTVKVGCSADDDCVTSITGELTTPTVSQDGTTHILSIS